MIKIDDEKRQLLLRSVKCHFSDRHDETIGDLKAEMLLDFFIEHLGPPVYNQAIKDARTFMQEKLVDLEAEFYAIEKR